MQTWSESISAEMSGNSSDLQATVMPDLPNELQREIFERVAMLNGKSAFVLTQVASYVNSWVHPILYQRIVIRSPHAASCFIRNTRSKPKDHFSKIVKSLTLTENVTLRQVKPVLAELRHFISFTLFGPAYSQEMFNILDFIRSPYLRRMTLVYRGTPPKERTAYRIHEIPVQILTTLTHLTIITQDRLDLFNSQWLTLAVAKSMAGTGVTSAGSVPIPHTQEIFQHLTHFAASFCRYPDVHTIGKVAHNLRYFVVLLPQDSSYMTKPGLLECARLQTGYHMVILKDLGDTALWNVDDCFGPSNFWKRVEELVADGYVSDEGDLKERATGSHLNPYNMVITPT